MLSLFNMITIICLLALIGAVAKATKDNPTCNCQDTQAQEELRSLRAEFNKFRTNIHMSLDFALTNNNEVSKRNGEIRLDVNLLRIQMCNLTDDVKAAESKVQNQITAAESKLQNQITTNVASLKEEITNNKNENNKLVTRMMNVEQQTTTLSKRVAFDFRNDGEFYGRKTNEIVIYNKQLTNIGNAFDGRTGKFRAPFRGLYHFGFHASFLPRLDPGATIRHNGVGQSVTNNFLSGEKSSSGITDVLWLEVGDQVWVQTWSWLYRYYGFNGFLIIPA